MAVESSTDIGQRLLRKVDPAELPSGEMPDAGENATEIRDADTVAIDASNAGLHAMLNERFPNLLIHGSIDYLRRQGVVSHLVRGPHEIVIGLHREIGVRILTDAVLPLRLFAGKARVRNAIGAIGTRASGIRCAIRNT